jgi:hypothetical protein
MEQKDRDMLITLSANFNCFLKDWSYIKANGFSFCQKRQAEIDDLQKSMAWIRNTVFALIFLLLTATVGYFAHDSHAEGGRVGWLRSQVSDQPK